MVRQVRQGDPLGPTLFSIYVNDIFNELDIDHSDYVTLNEINKISALLLSDDFVLISTSKSGLQKYLNALQKYMKIWKLKINYKKSKCITFSRSNYKDKHQFTINNKISQNINDYKTLGITFNKKGSFLPTLDDLSCKTKRAI